MAEKKKRVISIDLLRGIVMAFMCLDHTREYFSSVRFNPADLAQTTAALFMTRWITNFCAPVFIFLAGAGAYLFTKRGRTKKELSWFLFSRGAFLVILELTVIRFVCCFNFNLYITDANVCQVIWAIGWSLIILSVLVYLPLWAIALFGTVTVLGHNIMDFIDTENLTQLKWLHVVLHSRDIVTIAPGISYKMVYPLIPWCGVMALGFLFGKTVFLEATKRRRVFFWLGLGLTVLFIVLRALDVYGDPSKWSHQKDWLFTLFSFLDCTKYPASLLFLLMTLGPSILLLSAFREEEGPVTRFFLVFGRIALFFYIMHLLFIHIAAVILAVIRYGVFPSWLFEGNPIFSIPPFPTGPQDYGYSLPVVYLIWIVIMLILYPLCRWYMTFKKTHSHPILSYL